MGSVKAVETIKLEADVNVGTLNSKDERIPGFCITVYLKSEQCKWKSKSISGGRVRSKADACVVARPSSPSLTHGMVKP